MQENYNSTIEKLDKGVYGKVEYRGETHCPRCGKSGEAIRTEKFVITVCKHCDFSMGMPYEKQVA